MNFLVGVLFGELVSVVVLHPNVPSGGWTIFSGAQYVALQKYFSHWVWVYSHFSNSTYNKKTVTANRWVTTNNSELSLSGQYETETSSQIIFITLSSLADVRLGLCLLPASAILAKNCWAKPASFDFASFNFNFQWSHTEHWRSCSYVVNWRCNECCKVFSVLGMSVCSMNNSLFRQGWCQRARSAYSAIDEILKWEHLS